MTIEELKELFLEAWNAQAESSRDRSASAFHYLVGALFPREDWGLFR